MLSGPLLSLPRSRSVLSDLSSCLHAGLHGVGPALLFGLVCRLSQLRRYFAARLHEVRGVYGMLESIADGALDHSPLHLLESSATQVSFSMFSGSVLSCQPPLYHAFWWFAGSGEGSKQLLFSSHVRGFSGPQLMSFT